MSFTGLVWGFLQIVDNGIASDFFRHPYYSFTFLPPSFCIHLPPCSLVRAHFPHFPNQITYSLLLIYLFISGADSRRFLTFRLGCLWRASDLELPWTQGHSTGLGHTGAVFSGTAHRLFPTQHLLFFFPPGCELRTAFTFLSG